MSDLCFMRVLHVSHQDKEAEKKERQSTPHLWNLNPDPQLTGMIVHMIKSGKLMIIVKERLWQLSADCDLNLFNLSNSRSRHSRQQKG